MSNKWAVLGLGFIAPRHIKAIESVGDELIATVDPKLKARAMFNNLDKLKKSPLWKEVTHVAICTPNFLHHELSEACGKRRVVLCEKPICLEADNEFKDNVYSVLQLRYHPEVIKAKKKYKSGVHSGTMIVRVKRDREYWNSWKGSPALSGGILFNLGVHYFDLLIYLFGDNYTIKSAVSGERRAEGTIDFNGSQFDYLIEILDDNKDQDRSLEIDGEVLELSKKDNLSFEDLHIEVYKALLAGNGITAQEALKSIKLIEAIKYA